MTDEVGDEEDDPGPRQHDGRMVVDEDEPHPHDRAGDRVGQHDEGVEHRVRPRRAPGQAVGEEDAETHVEDDGERGEHERVGDGTGDEVEHGRVALQAQAEVHDRSPRRHERGHQDGHGGNEGERDHPVDGGGGRDEPAARRGPRLKRPEAHHVVRLPEGEVALTHERGRVDQDEQAAEGAGHRGVAAELVDEFPVHEGREGAEALAEHHRRAEVGHRRHEHEEGARGERREDDGQDDAEEGLARAGPEADRRVLHRPTDRRPPPRRTRRNTSGKYWTTNASSTPSVAVDRRHAPPEGLEPPGHQAVAAQQGPPTSRRR